MDHFDDEPEHEPEAGAPSEAVTAVSEPVVMPAMRTVEEWAEAKGLWPERILPEAQKVDIAPTPDDRMGSYHQISRGHLGITVNPDSWKFTAAKVRHHWPIGKMVTESEFDAAIDEHKQVICR